MCLVTAVRGFCENKNHYTCNSLLTSLTELCPESVCLKTSLDLMQKIMYLSEKKEAWLKAT